ncbi:hypothetical protein PILCRDRAFT_35855, partial [Piloderma croceum F 1598]
MASSLSPQCTPLKHAYDKCFNSWFEGYLQPAIEDEEETRRAYSKRKAQEFEEKCGKVWESYRACISKAVTEKGLDTLLDQARQENPLRDPEPTVPSPSAPKS